MPSSDYVQVPRDWIEKLKAANGDTGIDLVEQLQSEHIPVMDIDSITEGYKLVPTEPTDDMITAGADAINGYRVDVMRSYEAMVEAANTPGYKIDPGINPEKIIAWAKDIGRRHGTEFQGGTVEVLIADAVLEAHEWLRVNERPQSLEDEIKEKERIAMSRGIAIALSGIDFKATEYHEIVMSQGGYEELLKDVEEYDREHLLMTAYANLEKEEADALMDKYGPKPSGKGGI